MKKLLVLVLGMFVVVACADDRNGGTGEVTEKLETSLIKVESVTTDLGVVENGSIHNFTFRIINKTSEETVLKRIGGTGMSGATYGDCIEDFEPPILTIGGSQICDAVVNTPVDFSTNSQITLFYEDANKETISIVLARFTIKPVK